jgi:hypothetical protein
MDIRPTMLTKSPMMVVLTAVASCGNPVSWSDDGGSGGLGSGGNGGSGGGSLVPGDGGIYAGSPDRTGCLAPPGADAGIQVEVNH